MDRATPRRTEHPGPPAITGRRKTTDGAPTSLLARPGLRRLSADMAPLPTGKEAPEPVEPTGPFNIHPSGPGTLFTNAAGATLTKSGGTAITSLTVPFDNDGTLNANSGVLNLGGPFANYNTGTRILSRGRYSIAATLRFPGADVVTNTADVELVGPASQLQDTSGQNGLRNLSTNTATGAITIRDGRELTIPGPFTRTETSQWAPRAPSSPPATTPKPLAPPPSPTRPPRSAPSEGWWTSKEGPWVESARWNRCSATPTPSARAFRQESSPLPACSTRLPTVARPSRSPGRRLARAMTSWL